MDMEIEFKNIIKDIIADSKLSQQKKEKKIGTSQGTISKWISGTQEPRFYQLQKIATVFAVDTDYLLGLKDI